MEKLSTIMEKDPGPKPPATPCQRCKQPAEPKNVPLIGWRQQEYCETCAELLAAERRREIGEYERKREIDNLLVRSELRGRLLDMTFETFDPRPAGKAYDIAKEYAEKFGKETTEGLMLYGKAGSGKTHLACAITRHIIEQKRIQVIFTRIVDLLSEIRQTYSEDEYCRTENESDLIRKYAGAPLLIIDDLGAEKTTDWVRQILYQIIDERWIEQKPIIVTSNLNLEELEARFEERIASRVAGMCRLVESRDYDYRIKKPIP